MLLTGLFLLLIMTAASADAPSPAELAPFLAPTALFFGIGAGGFFCGARLHGSEGYACAAISAAMLTALLLAVKLLIPAPDDVPVLFDVPFKSAREGMFSYSSVSDASHEGDVLRRLADAHAVSVDEAADGGSLFEEEAPGARPSPEVFFDDDLLLDAVTREFDRDRATRLGTAFHRLAQYSVVARRDAGPLAPPPAERVAALSRSCDLDEAQKDRLGAALDRWFGSDVAARMAELENLSAEAPFLVTVPLGEGEAYLEGEIDLIGFDEPRERAVVVDYKTGGSPAESEGDLSAKHVLQGTCYAYAVMRQGASSVDTVFVRVERPRADDPSQPQCVRYRFAKDDLPALERAIAEVYARSE